MAKNTRLTDLAVNAEADAFGALMNGGFIDIYDGTQPTSSDDAINGQRLGVTLTFGNPAFIPAIGGILSANPINSGVIVNQINPATWARIYRSDHKTVVMDVSVGMDDPRAGLIYNIALPTVHLVPGVTLSFSSFTHSVAKSTPGF